MVRVEVGPASEPVVRGSEGTGIGHFGEPGIQTGEVGTRAERTAHGGHEVGREPRQRVLTREQELGSRNGVVAPELEQTGGVRRSGSFENELFALKLIKAF